MSYQPPAPPSYGYAPAPAQGSQGQAPVQQGPYHDHTTASASHQPPQPMNTSYAPPNPAGGAQGGGGAQGYAPQSAPPQGQGVAQPNAFPLPMGNMGAMGPMGHMPLQQMGGLAGAFVQQYVSQQAASGGWFSWLRFSAWRSYFSVSNSYVVNKLRVILFPFGHKWRRSQAPMPGNPQQLVFMPPRDDINAPDLYIPLMSFITYILLTGLALGVYHRFDPEALSMTASSAMVALFIEVALLKFGFYVLATSVVPPLLDLLSYSSYKFVGLIINIALGIFLGYRVFFIATLVNACFFARFMMLTVKNATARTISTEQGMAVKRSGFVIAIGALQLIICYLLVRNTIPVDEAPPSTVTL